jgi:hypothetical protein
MPEKMSRTTVDDCGSTVGSGETLLTAVGVSGAGAGEGAVAHPNIPTPRKSMAKKNTVALNVCVKRLVDRKCFVTAKPLLSVSYENTSQRALIPTATLSIYEGVCLLLSLESWQFNSRLQIS